MVHIRRMATEHGSCRTLFSDDLKRVNMDYREHPLFHNNLCQWAGCDTQCHTVPHFLEHILISHGLNDRSTAECRVQTQVVSYLEAQLKKERERLSAMMAHLHTLPSKSLSISSIVSLNQQFPESPTSPPRPEYASSSDNISPGLKLAQSPEISPQLDLSSQNNKSPAETASLSQAPSRHSADEASPLATINLTSSTSLTSMTALPSLSNLSNGLPSLSNGLPSLPTLQGIYDTMLPRLPTATSPLRFEGTNGESKHRSTSAPAPGSILTNAALYQNPNVKPPFTYASLIREAIVSSPDQRMSLNEIYTWFSHTFAFFRYNNSQWKNAVRHNLSLHKCFQRVEGPVGSGWTVNEDEFQLRRANRVNAVRSMEDESNPAGMTVPHNYLQSIQEHMFRLQEQMMSNNSNVASQNSIVKMEDNCEEK